MPTPPIEIRGLEFRYRDGERGAVLAGVHFVVERGSRVLLIGPNGAGKTTLLRVIAGKHLVPHDAVRVLGRPAFHDPALAARVTFLGGPFPFDVDVRVDEILARLRDDDPDRRARLCAILGIDPAWHMDRVSDGQRRRVQLLLGLLRPAEVLLLDEVTTDLDLCARADLLDFLQEESEARGATIVYATHILDRLEEWATHVALMADGRLARFSPIGDLTEVAELRAAGAAAPLTRFALAWMRRRG